MVSYCETDSYLLDNHRLTNFRDCHSPNLESCTTTKVKTNVALVSLSGCRLCLYRPRLCLSILQRQVLQTVFYKQWADFQILANKSFPLLLLTHDYSTDFTSVFASSISVISQFHYIFKFKAALSFSSIFVSLPHLGFMFYQLFDMIYIGLTIVTCICLSSWGTVPDLSVKMQVWMDDITQAWGEDSGL